MSRRCSRTLNLSFSDRSVLFTALCSLRKDKEDLLSLYEGCSDEETLISHDSIRDDIDSIDRLLDIFSDRRLFS